MANEEIQPGEPKRNVPKRDAEEKPRRRSRDEDEEEDEDDSDALVRRRVRRRDETDATGGLIPYKNGMALASYYVGVFSLIPCLGILLGILAIIFGILGLRHASLYPNSRGQAHAIIGIVLGVIGILEVPVGFLILRMMGQR